MVNRRIITVQDIMRSNDIPCWVMYCAEKSDPYFMKIVTPKTTAPSVAIIGSKECSVIVHSLDIDNVERYDNVHVVAYEKEGKLWQEIENALESIGLPDTISLTYSTLKDAQVDVIGYGLYKFLTRRLRKLYTNNSRKVKFSSAEELVYAFSDRKDETEISKIRLAARRALEILESAFQNMVPGMTELEAVDLVHSLTEQKPAYFKEMGVVNEEYAWEKDVCPIVLAGPSLKKGGHAAASDLRIERGFTVYFDFGVQLTFEDGSKWSSDIQRMGYVLKEGKIDPPADVSRIFRTLTEAIAVGMETIRPGMKGYEVDAVVRGHVLKEGYPDYNHATGHAIGELAHNPGASLSSKSRKLSHLRVQLNGVYSIEPRIAIPNGGSVEEMVLVTSNGGVALCQQQKTLYLIG